MWYECACNCVLAYVDGSTCVCEDAVMCVYTCGGYWLSITSLGICVSAGDLNSGPQGLTEELCSLAISLALDSCFLQDMVGCMPLTTAIGRQRQADLSLRLA